MSTNELVNSEGRPKRPSPTPRVFARGIKAEHLVEDVRWRHPHYVTCKCGWSFHGHSVDRVERAWKDHRGPQK